MITRRGSHFLKPQLFRRKHRNPKPLCQDWKEIVPQFWSSKKARRPKIQRRSKILFLQDKITYKEKLTVRELNYSNYDVPVTSKNFLGHNFKWTTFHHKLLKWSTLAKYRRHAHKISLPLRHLITGASDSLSSLIIFQTVMTQQWILLQLYIFLLSDCYHRQLQVGSCYWYWIWSNACDFGHNKQRDLSSERSWRISSNLYWWSGR